MVKNIKQSWFRLRRVRVQSALCPEPPIIFKRVTDINIGKHRLEPRWQIHTPFARHGAPAELLDWLLDPSSLTRRLQACCCGAFHVLPLTQRWQRPRLSEAQALGVQPRAICFVREVHLLCDGQPWVFARTVIPVRTLSGPRRRLRQLGGKPLGAALFADPGMCRSAIEIAPLRPGQPLFDHASVRLDPQIVRRVVQQTDAIWGRRSVFFLDGHPLLVNEIFLPGIDYGEIP